MEGLGMKWPCTTSRCNPWHIIRGERFLIVFPTLGQNLAPPK